jgi:hypothetical protein
MAERETAGPCCAQDDKGSNKKRAGGVLRRAWIAAAMRRLFGDSGAFGFAGDALDEGQAIRFAEASDIVPAGGDGE